MASVRGRSDSPKPLGLQPGSKSPLPKSTNGTKTANHAPRSKSASISPSRAGSASRPRSRSRSMSVSRSGSGSRFSGSRSRSPRPKRARSYTVSRSRSRSRSYSSYSSRTGSRDSVGGGSGSKVVEVSKLTKNVTTQHIREIFGVYGAIKDVDLPIVRRIGSHRGTAIVTFETAKAAQKAISHMDRGQLDGSLISVRVPRPPSPPRGPAALRRGGNGYRAGPPENRSASTRGPVPARRMNSPPRRAFGGRSRSPPRRDFGGDGRAPASRPVRSRSPPYRRKRSPSRSLSRSPRRGVRRASPQYGARRGSPQRSSRRNRSYSRSSSSSYTRSSQSRSRSPRR